MPHFELFVEPSFHRSLRAASYGGHPKTVAIVNQLIE
jgi:hypothetical protein